MITNKWIDVAKQLPTQGDAQPEMGDQVYVYWDGVGGPAWGFAHWQKVDHLSRGKYRAVTHWQPIEKP
jgi:hypothetical protein